VPEIYSVQIVLRGVRDQRSVRISGSQRPDGRTRLQIDGGEDDDGSSLDWIFGDWPALQLELGRMLRQYLAAGYMIAAQQSQLPEPLSDLAVAPDPYRLGTDEDEPRSH
jgi:hypothetical protein